MHPSRTLIANASALWIALIGALLGCGPTEPAVVVFIREVPVKTAAIEAILRIGSAERGPYQIKEGISGAGPHLAFRLAQGTRGSIGISLSARDADGEEIARGTDSVLLAEDEHYDLEVALRLLPPVLLSATPPSLLHTEGGPVSLKGARFSPDAVVLLDGKQVTASVRSASEIDVLLPPRPGSCGGASLSVRNPDQQSATRSDLVAYRSTALGYKPLRLIPLGGPSSALQVADINGDKAPDLIALGSSQDAVRIALGNGDGSFRTQTQTDAPARIVLRDLALADMDGDSDLDLILSIEDSGQSIGGVALWFNDGTGVPRSFQSTLFSHLGETRSVAATDLNGDGLADVVFSAATIRRAGEYERTPLVATLLGEGKGKLSRLLSSSVLGGGSFIITDLSLRIADLNLDRRPDVVLRAPDSPGGVFFALGIGDGGLGALIGPPMENFSVSAIAVGDLDRDGVAEVAATGTDGIALLKSGKGGAPALIPPKLTGFLRGTAVAMADVDGDGRTDLLMTEMSGLLRILSRGPDGSFSAVSSLASGVMSPSWIVTADVDRDGVLDLLTGGLSGGNAALFLGQCL